MDFKAPQYIVYFLKKSSLILDDNDQSNKNLISVCTTFEELTQKVNAYKGTHEVRIFPVFSTCFNNIEDATVFHQQKVIADFDISKLNDVVSMIVTDVFKENKDKDEKSKLLLSILEIFKSIHNSSIEVDVDHISFKAEYNETGDLIDITAQNLYSLLLQFGIPVKYDDVKELKEFHMPYGAFVYDGEPKFLPVKK